MKKASATAIPGTPTPPRELVARAQAIELGQFLKFHGAAGSGGEAKRLIQDGKVLLDGKIETRKGKKLVAGDEIALGDRRWVVPDGVRRSGDSR